MKTTLGLTQFGMRLFRWLTILLVGVPIGLYLVYRIAALLWMDPVLSLLHPVLRLFAEPIVAVCGEQFLQRHGGLKACAFLTPLFYLPVAYLTALVLGRLSKEKMTANHTPGGIRRPEDGSPKPSV